MKDGQISPGVRGADVRHVACFGKLGPGLLKRRSRFSVRAWPVLWWV